MLLMDSGRKSDWNRPVLRCHCNERASSIGRGVANPLRTSGLKLKERTPGRWSHRASMAHR